MTEKTPALTPEQLNELRLIQADMAIEGYALDWDGLLRMGERFYGSDKPREIRAIVRAAVDEGRPVLQALKEQYGEPAPPADLSKPEA